MNVQAVALRRCCLMLSLLTNLGMLFTFKYWGFFADITNAVGQELGGTWRIEPLAVLLPVGISFYTFQTLGYTIDVYKRQIPAERHFGRFALYVSFFPQLVAGPIERASHLLPQLKSLPGFDYQRSVSGLRLIVYGFFKKVVIADNVALYVDPIFTNVTQYSGVPLLIATYLFAFQILCDFSGYTDIARGTGRLFGVDLMENFKRPYFSRSFSEFWQRWHVSLSSWFRDYLYIPLGGNRVSQLRWAMNILIVFLVSGLWHGAHSRFVLWGGLHGLYLLIEYALFALLARIWRSDDRAPLLFRVLWGVVVFNLVCLAWIFFRAESLSDAVYVVQNLFTTTRGKMHFVDAGLWSAVAGIAVLEALEYLRFERNLGGRIDALPSGLRWGIYATALWVVIFWGNFSSQEFVYFQF
jgi:D-alanyl-lipoteichoic acid acyltransferase DltB (MBOAT superfamily)